MAILVVTPARNPRAAPAAKNHHKQCHTNNETLLPGTMTTMSVINDTKPPERLHDDHLPPAKSQPNCSKHKPFKQHLPEKKNKEKKR
ncbi:42796_t:CDS:2 [Gigaspora margarita]|uniref:42796_t:CDS:1 n=1 Tax=Gigaspora margarita TaxID=4874 RepID=A0ABN7VBU2_GIGMA|nr:42796_t:CDS:2 [Gigaspora margarita]